MSEQDRDNSDLLPLSSALKIDQLCADFEEAWHAGRNPRIEEYLAHVHSSLRRVALRELIAQEVDLRRSHGESANSHEYYGRFPQAEEVVKSAFASIAARDETADPAAVPRPPVSQWLEAACHDRPIRRRAGTGQRRVCQCVFGAGPHVGATGGPQGPATLKAGRNLAF